MWSLWCRGEFRSPGPSPRRFWRRRSDGEPRAPALLDLAEDRVETKQGCLCTPDIAKEQGISVAEAIRRCLDQQLDAAEPPRTDRYANAARAIGQFHDAHGASDLAESHDAYLVLPSE